MKCGDKVFIRTGRRDAELREATVVTVGRVYITAEIGRTTYRFSIEPHADGHHYGEYGSQLWPTREAEDEARWADEERHRLRDLILKATPAELRAIGAALVKP